MCESLMLHHLSHSEITQWRGVTNHSGFHRSHLRIGGLYFFWVTRISSGFVVVAHIQICSKYQSKMWGEMCQNQRCLCQPAVLTLRIHQYSSWLFNIRAFQKRKRKKRNTSRESDQTANHLIPTFWKRCAFLLDCLFVGLAKSSVNCLKFPS